MTTGRTITLCFLIVVLGIIITLSGGCGDSDMRCTKETGMFKAKVIGHSEEKQAGRDSSNTCKRTLQVTIMQWEDNGKTFTKCHHLGEMNQVMEFPRTEKVCVPINRPINNTQDGH